MKKASLAWFALVAALVVACGSGGASPAPVENAVAPAPPPAPGEYAIANRMEILKPVNVDAMNHESQTAVVVEDRGASVVMDVTYYPLRGAQTVTSNPTWRTDDAAMAEWLQPGVTANFDDAMKADLVSALAKDGIDPAAHTDKGLVEKVTKWLLANFSGNAPFIAYDVTFDGGVPVVKPELRRAFDEEKSKFGLATDDEAFQRGLFGKGLFYARLHGSCTPSAILWTTALRALGIPTRIVLTTPPVDANAPSQVDWLGANVRNDAVKKVLDAGIAPAIGSWANHTFVEVWVGKTWVRLNYDRLGQPILDPHYFGLLTVVNRFRDWSESGLAETWGAYVAGVESGAPASLGSVNPYRSWSFADNAPAP
jgi:hypothetical protein